jgi:hypothetical protein
MSTTHVGQAPEVEEPDFDKDVKVFKSRPLVVSWATCCRCGRQAVKLTVDGLCDDICGPIEAATELATRRTRTKGS